jgi:type IV pilus secretin PilQ/predicted competence protein
MRTRTIASAAFALALLGTVTAQNTPASSSAEQPAATVAGAQPTQHTVSREKDTLSVDFPDEDIKTILRNVADLFELNLVVPDTLVGKTSIKLRDVTWRQIFETVLSPVNYTYVEEGNIVKVVSRDSLMQEPVSTEVFILNNAKAIDIKPTVDGLVDPAQGGKILIDARSNALVISTQPSRITRIRAIIEKLDKATDQVMIESKFVEVSDSDIRNIGVNWASLQGMNLGVSKISQTFSRERGQESTGKGSLNDKTSTTHVVTPSNLGPNGTFGTGQLNLPQGNATVPSQAIPADVRVADYKIDPDTGVATFTAPVSNTSLLDNLASLTNTGSTSRLATAVFSSSDFNIIVSALKQQNNTKVVSNPTIVTLNNTEAFINIGQEYPIPSYTYNSERGTFEVSGFQYKPIGVIMKVTPQVNAQGTIRMVIEPEISSTEKETTFGGAGGANIPIISTRKVKTQVSLKDGYTAGIGGLMSFSKKHGGTKVPVLGSIPVLGRLFSSSNVNDVTTNLLIFITAKTVAADGADPAQVFNAAALEAAGETPSAKVTK